ncbi:MAG: hypothetical protein HZC41_09275 [Chloroflexi bacterium]|nr:hypothetical protein [Chloroflexota bacterium]
MKARNRRLPSPPRPRVPLDIPPISLMSPTGPPVTPAAVPSNWPDDLGLNELANALALHRRYLPFVRQTLSALTTDAAVIAWRQAVLADFRRSPALVERVEALLPRLAELREGRALLGGRQRHVLLQTADRLAELDLYTGVVQELHDALQVAPLESPALVALRAGVATLLEDAAFQELRRDLPQLRAPLENIRSITVGINLDTQLLPASAVLLAVNDVKLGEAASLFNRLIGARDGDEDSGIAPLHTVPANPDERPLSPLFQDLDRILAQVAQPVARALTRYVKTGSSWLANLEYECAFFIGATRLMERLAAQGVPLCQPDSAPVEERNTTLDGLVNVALALRGGPPPVPSDARLDADGRIAILTGPNSGGKTTYLRGVGLAQVLFQAGLWVTARAARLSPADYILTHFPALETRQQGRLAEEAGRLRQLFQQATAHSLVLLNETFSSTASGEALYLAQDVLAALRVIGARAVFATHLSELAARIPDIEAAVTGDSRLVSLVAGVRLADDGQAVPTFVIAPGIPLGRSYAQEIARRHGISLEQILAARRDNGD